MSEHVASPQSTGGAGYSFEDCEVAWWALCMLLGRPVLDAELGVPVAIRLQVRVDDWRLDDFVAEFPGSGQRPRFAAVSAKKDKYVNSKGFHGEFVKECWQQLVHPGASRFLPEHDRLVLCCGKLADTVSEAVDDLINLASGDPAQFGIRINVPRWSNSLVRTLADSFACPQDVSATSTQRSTPGHLLQSIRVHERDWLSTSSQWQAEALHRAREAVATGSEADAKRLWDILCALRPVLARKSGVIELQTITNAARGQVTLREFPDFTNIWRGIRATTEIWKSEIRNAFGGKCTLPREKPLRELRSRLSADPVVAVVGNSGSGKSALVRAALDDELNARNTFVLAARCSDLDLLVRAHGEALKQALSLVTTNNAVLVLDSCEYLEWAPDIHAIARVLDGLSIGQPGSRWRIILVAQAGSLETVVGSLAKAVENFPPACAVVEIDDLSDEELDTVSAAFPALTPLIRYETQRRLLARPAVLELFVRVPTDRPPTSFSNLSALHDWYWKQFVSAPPGGDGRAGTAKAIATYLAETDIHRMPIDQLSAPDRSRVAELERLGMLRRGFETVSFAHDSYAALAKERVLLGRIEAYGTRGLPSSLHSWLDGLGLLSLRLVEAGPVGGIDWPQLYDAVEKSRHQDAIDAVTDVLFSAADVDAVLGGVLPTLLKNKGRPLRRMLKRITFSWSRLRPDLIDSVAGISQGDRWRITSLIEARIPTGRRWLRVMDWISHNPHPLLSAARAEIFSICRLWINLARFLGDQTLAHATVAADYILAEAESECRQEYSAGAPDSEIVIKSTLLCHGWFPERTARIIRTLAGVEPLPLPEELTRKDIFPRGQSRSLFPKETPPPWSIGPLRRPSDDLRRIVLAEPWAEYLVDILGPQVAAEVFLAVLILSPSERRDAVGGDRSGLQQHVCYPPDFWFPPVLALLSQSPPVAVSFATTLVDFASARWLEWTTEPGENPGTRVTMPDGSLREFAGGPDVFAWSRGGTTGADSVKAVLMTLENWLYTRLESEEGRPKAEQVLDLLLRSSTSVAILGLLCDVAFRLPVLLFSKLEPLVTGRELYLWTLHRNVPHAVNVAMIGWWGEPAEQRERILKFHMLEHRNHELQDIVIELLAHKNFSWPALLAARSQWKTDPTEDELYFERLAAYFDPRHWHRQEVDGRIQWQLQLPHDIVARSEAEAQVASESLASYLQPLKWGRVLSGDKGVNEDEVVAEIRKLIATPKSDLRNPSSLRASEICGIASIAIVHCAALLDSDPEMAHWCRRALLDICLSPPPSESLDTRDSITLYSWDEFCARGIATLWIRSPQDRQLRRAVGMLMVGPHDKTTATIMETVAPHRRVLGAHFDLLLDLSAFISRTVLVLHWSPTLGIAVQWTSALGDAIDDFAAGRSYILGANWLEVAATEAPLLRFGGWLRRAWHRLRQALHCSIHPRVLGSLPRWVNVELPDRQRPGQVIPHGLWNQTFVAGLAWLPSELRSVNQHDEQLSQLVHRVAHVVAASANHAATRHRGDRYARPHPHESEQKLIEFVAISVSRHPSDVERLLDIYFQVPRECASWLVDLVRSIYSEWFRGRMEFSIRPGVLLTLLKYTAAWDQRTQDNKSRDRERAELLNCLLGTDVYTPVHQVWPSEARSAVSSLLPWLEYWWTLAANEPDCVAGFCIFLQAPACEGLRPVCLRWIQSEHVIRLGGWGQKIDALITLLELTAPSSGVDDTHWQALLDAAQGDQDAGALALSERIGNNDKE